MREWESERVRELESERYRGGGGGSCRVDNFHLIKIEIAFFSKTDIRYKIF